MLDLLVLLVFLLIQMLTCTGTICSGDDTLAGPLYNEKVFFVVL